MEDRLCLLFDFALFFPFEPHLLRQSGSQVQAEERRGRDGGGGEGKEGGGVGGSSESEENPAEQEAETGERKGKPSRGYG